VVGTACKSYKKKINFFPLRSSSLTSLSGERRRTTRGCCSFLFFFCFSFLFFSTFLPVSLLSLAHTDRRDHREPLASGIGSASSAQRQRASREGKRSRFDRERLRRTAVSLSLPPFLLLPKTRCPTSSRPTPSRSSTARSSRTSSGGSARSLWARAWTSEWLFFCSDRFRRFGDPSVRAVLFSFSFFVRPLALAHRFLLLFLLLLLLLLLKPAQIRPRRAARHVGGQAAGFGGAGRSSPRLCLCSSFCREIPGSGRRRRRGRGGAPRPRPFDGRSRSGRAPAVSDVDPAARRRRSRRCGRRSGRRRSSPSSCRGAAAARRASSRRHPPARRPSSLTGDGQSRRPPRALRFLFRWR